MTKEQYTRIIERIINSPRNDLQKIGILQQGFELYVREHNYVSEHNDEQVNDTDCEYCQYPFKHCGKYYISTGYNNDSYLHTIRREDSIGGVMIKYCPWCGREVDPLC